MEVPSASPVDTAVEEMLRLQVIERGITDGRVLAAMRAVPRDRFFPPGTRDNVYADRAHPIGYGQTISQPYIVALMSQRLMLEPTHRVLELGTGSGYQTAVLAKLAGEIYTIERIKPLLDVAFERLQSLGLRNIRFRHGDGLNGWPEQGLDTAHGGFDRILIAAGTSVLPTLLLEKQLRMNGLAILPLGPDDQQVLTLIQRMETGFQQTPICPVRFVKLIPGLH